MRRTKAYPIVLFACAAFAASANATDLDKVNAWIVSNKPWMACHPPSLVPNPNNPGFTFNGALSTTPPMGWCKQSGPHVWKPTKNKSAMWWVQVVTNLRPTGCTGSSCLRDLIRVCSPSYVRPSSAPAIPGGGPCQSSNGVGPGGCEVCEVPAP